MCLHEIGDDALSAPPILRDSTNITRKYIFIYGGSLYISFVSSTEAVAAVSVSWIFKFKLAVATFAPFMHLLELSFQPSSFVFQLFSDRNVYYIYDKLTFSKFSSSNEYILLAILAPSTVWACFFLILRIASTSVFARILSSSPKTSIKSRR